MKLLLPLLLATAAGALAGERTVAIHESSGSRCCRTIFTTEAGTPGAYYRSSLGHTAIRLINDTPGFMTFFVYSGDVCGSNDLNGLIRRGAHVYEVVVPPKHTSYADERGPHYWVGSKPGRWGIDMMHNRVAPLPW